MVLVREERRRTRGRVRLAFADPLSLPRSSAPGTHPRWGTIRGIVHALPLRERAPAALDLAEWRARMGSEVRGLFLLARAAPGLEHAAEHGRHA